MEDIERYQLYLQNSASLARSLEKLVEDDKSDSRTGLSGEAETIYRQHCDKACDLLRKMQKRIMVLISESSTELI